MHVSSFSGWNSQRGRSAEFMMMVIMSICVKDDIVKMTSFGFYCFTGHGGKTMVVAAAAFSGKGCASDDFMNMLTAVGIIVRCIWIIVTHIELPQND